MTRQEAEKIIREVIAKHAGEPMQKNLFKLSVDQLLTKVNQNSSKTTAN